MTTFQQNAFESQSSAERSHLTLRRVRSQLTAVLGMKRPWVMENVSLSQTMTARSTCVLQLANVAWASVGFEEHRRAFLDVFNFLAILRRVPSNELLDECANTVCKLYEVRP